jgi:hypothetical protein
MSSNTFSCFFTAAPHNSEMTTQEYKPRFGHDMRIKKPGAKVVRTATHECARPDCSKEGTHQVPKSRENTNEHFWFCLEHARAHNESWDYFSGMSETEIAQFRVDALTGHRPTWPMGKRGARARTGQYQMQDRYRVVDDEADKPAVRRPERTLTRPQLVALEMLNLDASATLDQIKARYKELVKRFHPDANGGDRGAEERLKRVIQAYGVLRASGVAR